MQSQKVENEEYVMKDISSQQNRVQDQAAKFRQYQQENRSAELDGMDDELGFNNFGKFDNQQELERQFKEYHR